MEKILKLLKGLANGRISVLRFIAILIAGALAWAIFSALEGIIGNEASSYWNTVSPLLDIEVPLLIMCLVSLIIVAVAFVIGIAASKKLQVPNGEEKFDLHEKHVYYDDTEGDTVNTVVGQLLSERIKMVDGEISSSEFASHVLYMLNQRKITDQAAKKLLIGTEFFVLMAGDGQYILGVQNDKTS